MNPIKKKKGHYYARTHTHTHTHTHTLTHSQGLTPKNVNNIVHG